jgi:tetratricopeptide (TPR) repeat protein
VQKVTALAGLSVAVIARVKLGACVLTVIAIGSTAHAGSKLRPEHLEPIRVEAVPLRAEPRTEGDRKQPRTAPARSGVVAELYARGTKLYLTGDFPEAAVLFKRAIATDREYAPAHRGLGYVYQRMGFATLAVTELQRYLTLAPTAADAAAIALRIERLGGN